MPEVRIKDIDEHEIDTILAEDIDFEGHLTFKKPLMVKGKFKGEIRSSSSLYVGEKAYVEARIEANLVSSKGRIKGDVLGHSRVELFSTSHLEGDVTTPDFVVESGCKFNGLCNMGGAEKRKEGPQPGAAAAQTHPSGALAQPGPSAQAGHTDKNGAAPAPHEKPSPAAAPQKAQTPQTPPGGARP